MYFCITAFLLFSIIFTILHSVQKANAQEGSYTVIQPDGTQIVYTWDNSEMIEIEFSQLDNSMIIRGKHHTATNTTIYRTSGFTITKGKTNKRVTAYTGGKTYIYRGQGMSEDSRPVGDTTYSTYTINRDILMNSLVNDLGYTASQLKSGVTVYLSNIFRLGRRVDGDSYDTSTYDYKNYKDDSTGKGIADAAGWSQGALDSLKNYYDIQVNIQIIPSLINSYKVDYVDSKDENKVLKTAVSSKDVIIKEKYSHIPQEKFTISGSQYKYASKYKVVYENGQTSTNANWPIAYGPIAITHSYTSNAVLKVFYEEEISTTPYNIIISFVDEFGRDIADDENLGKHTAGDKFTYSQIESPITYKKVKYEYDYKWSYSYYSLNNKDVSVDKETNPNYPFFSALPQLKKGYHLYITLHYKEGDGNVDLTPIPTPIPTGTPTPTPTPTPEIPPIWVPLPEVKEEYFTESFSTGVIRADNRGAEKFTVTEGVPTTESLYGEVLATEYLFGYRLVKKVGTRKFPIVVTKEYTLEWEGAILPGKTTPEKLKEIVKVEQIIEVERAYGYWEIEWLDYYVIDKAKLSNYALPNEEITLSPNYTYYHTPDISYTKYSESEHIIPPKEALQGIQLPGQVVIGGKNKPTIPKEDFTYEAHIRTEPIKVKNDFLYFNRSVAVNDNIQEIEGSYPDTSRLISSEKRTDPNVLFKENQVIEATKLNGTYTSNGVIDYKRVAGVSSKYSSTISYMIHGINDVVIHTPVYCKASITADNDSYVQLINPDTSLVQLVLDEDIRLNDMVISISNTGHHSYKQGYYERDFSKSLRDPAVSYIASSNGTLRNEIKFPFDVYLDVGNDMDTKNDTFVKAHTWVVIGRSSPRVYLPLWVTEGVYTVEFRTVAVNGVDKINLTEERANTDLRNYVATDEIQVEVSGRIYGLTLYDISDYPMWQEAFRVKQSSVLKRNTTALRGTNNTNYNSLYIYDYTVGTKDQYGKETNRVSKFTVPLMDGSHPKYKNIGVLKTGYAFRFKLETLGSYFNDLSQVKIKPLFYHVDADGKNRTAVDLYYDEEINRTSRKLVQVGSALDKSNVKSIKTGDAYLAIPEQELKDTAIVRNVSYGTWASQIHQMFHYSEIKLRAPFRTFTNAAYADKVLNSPQKNDVIAAGIQRNTLTRTKQSYYGEYYLPAKIHVVPKGYDVYDHASKYGVTYKEDFWKKDGYIIVNFDIVAVDNEGNERISYLNGNNYLNLGHCSMWVMEGGIPSKTNYNGIDFSFKAGDFVLYYTNQSVKDDYTVGGTH